MQLIVFPDGSRIGFDNVSGYKVNGSNIDFTLDNGTTRTIATSSPASAAYFVTQIDALPPTTTTTQVTIVLKEPYIITSVEFPFTLQNTLITVHGSGFTQDALGLLWIEDVSGGMDFNGVSCTCQFIDSNTLRAWWLSDGDGQTQALAPCAMLIAYQDTNSVASNTLTGLSSNDGETFTSP